MSRNQNPTDHTLARTRSRRQFLAQLVTPVAAAAISPALAAAAATKSTKKPASKPKPAATAVTTGDPFASARPDLSVAKTPEERATLEKQWKGLVEVLESIRKVELPEGAAPAVAFAALPRDAAGSGSASGSNVARKKS
jgi:hypothetical protein